MAVSNKLVLPALPNKYERVYNKCWELDAYRNVSPGENTVPMFLQACEIFDDDLYKMELVDIGAGTGRGGHAIWKELGIPVTLMDFADNCLDEKVKDDLCDTLDFVRHDITQKSAHRFDLGYCCDMMEHLPEDQIDAALTNIFEMCSNVFFQISTQPDIFGQHPEIDEDLHLTVWSYRKWLKKFAEFGVVVHRSLETRHHVVFFTSGWCGFAFDKMRMNTNPEVVWDNMKQNFQLGIQQLNVFEEQPDQKVVLLAGGPSLNDHVDEIRQLKADGAKIVTVNNTYNWAKEHDLWPVNQVLLDCREWNKRFVEDVDDRNTYFVCSQVHPEIVKSLPPEKTWMFQGNMDPDSIFLVNEYIGEVYKDWVPIPGGSTVVMRTLPMLVTLGFRDVEIFGLDSCIGGAPVGDEIDYDNHHAYAQPENDVKDKSSVVTVRVAGKNFAVQPWHVTQAMEFFSSGMQAILKPLDITVHGTGLIAHCINEGLTVLDPLDLKEV